MKSTFDHLVILDFEATCKPGAPPDPQEIIEFPSVLVSLRDNAVLDEFSSFVRPVHHPALSEFCTELTGIRQEEVDGAPPFLEVYAAHRDWLVGHGLLDADGRGEERFAFVTCGDWDLQTMLPVQCAASELPVSALPKAYRRWINIKKIFAAVKLREKGFGMPSMLKALGLPLLGRHHRGIDDSHNIARITLALAALGGKMEITGKLSSSRYPEITVRLRWREREQEAVLRKRLLPTVLGLASGLFKTRIIRVFTEDGRPIVDEDELAELAPGALLRVSASKDLRG
ncbi:MAG: 3'-5' exonuclease [Nannocystaceae bacterium]